MKMSKLIASLIIVRHSSFSIGKKWEKNITGKTKVAAAAEEFFFRAGFGDNTKEKGAVFRDRMEYDGYKRAPCMTGLLLTFLKIEILSTFKDKEFIAQAFFILYFSQLSEEHSLSLLALPPF
jgi:hypothetical protein